MDPTVAFVMACIATAIALGGLILSVLNYVRARPAKPHLEVNARTLAVRPRRMECVVVNRGTGIAKDVTLNVASGVHSLFQGAHASTLEFAQAESFDLLLMPEDTEVELKVEWSQLPNLKKRQSFTRSFQV
jgi:hypothetical protein